MDSLPDRNRAREHRPSLRCERHQPATSVAGVGRQLHEAAALQRLERGGQRRAVHGKHRRDSPHAGRFRAVQGQGHHQRELPACQAERSQPRIEFAREGTCRPLRVQAQAVVADEQSALVRNGRPF
jgi:hypothetical protein